MSKRPSPEKKIKQQLVEYGKKISTAGMVIGSGGNISIRYQNTMLIKAKDVNMAKASEKDYIAIDLAKGILPDESYLVSSEYRMHILCYQARPDIFAVIHIHPLFCVALSAKIKSLKSRDYEFLANTGGSVQIIPHFRYGSLGLARAVSKVIKQENCVILKNHGLTCVGRTLEEAYMHCQAVERASQIYILKRRL